MRNNIATHNISPYSKSGMDPAQMMSKHNPNVLYIHNSNDSSNASIQNW